MGKLILGDRYGGFDLIFDNLRVIIGYGVYWKVHVYLVKANLGVGKIFDFCCWLVITYKHPVSLTTLSSSVDILASVKKPLFSN